MKPYYGMIVSKIWQYECCDTLDWTLVCERKKETKLSREEVNVMTVLINVTMSSKEFQFSIHLDSLLAMVAGAMIVITVLLLAILVICLKHLRQSF